MAKDGEKFDADDDERKQCIQAKNSLESYVTTVKLSFEEEKLRDKITDADRSKIQYKCEEVLEWLDKNQLAEKKEFERKHEELSGVCNPIYMKFYQAGHH